MIITTTMNRKDYALINHELVSEHRIALFAKNTYSIFTLFLLIRTSSLSIMNMSVSLESATC